MCTSTLWSSQRATWWCSPHKSTHHQTRCFLCSSVASSANGHDVDAAQGCALTSFDAPEDILVVAAASASCNSAAALGSCSMRGCCSRQCVISLAASLALRESDARLQPEQTSAGSAAVMPQACYCLQQVCTSLLAGHVCSACRCAWFYSSCRLSKLPQAQPE